MNRLIYALALIAMAVFLASCSRNTIQPSKEKESLKPQTATQTVTQTPESTASEDVLSYDEIEKLTGVEINMGVFGQNLPLPEKYPSDIFPLPDDASIINVNDSDDSNTLSIIFTTSKSFDESVAYFQEIMKDGTITVEDKQDASYFLMGTKKDYSIILTISMYNGDNISILLNVGPS